MKKILFTLMAAMSLSSVIAVPAHRRIVKIQQADGSIIEAMLSGDEYMQYYCDPNTGEMLKSLGMVKSGTPHRLSSPTRHEGDNYYPVLLIEFADKKFSDIYKTGDPEHPYASTVEMFDDYFNGENYTYMLSDGSFSQYFIDQSFGKYKPHFDMIGVITLEKNYNDYYGTGNNSTNTQTAIRDALQIACNQGEITAELLKRWDNDDNNVVDAVHAMFAGYSRSYGESASIIWPHNAQMGRYEVIEGSPAFYSYVCSTELLGLSTDAVMVDGIGVAVHEFSHVLGLPDFYDVNKTKGAEAVYGMDEYSVMDQGCYNRASRYPTSYTAAERIFMGWMEAEPLPFTLTDSTTVTLPLLADSAKAFIYRNPNNQNEAFLFENHGKSGWDSYFGNVSYNFIRGMLITHVDSTDNSWMNNRINTNCKHPGYTPVPADGELLAYNFACYKANRSDSTAMDIVNYRVSAFNDLWPCSVASEYSYKITTPDGVEYARKMGGPYTEFSANTTPKAVFYDGTEADFIIENIAEDLETNLITFSIKGKDYETVPSGIDEIESAKEGARIELRNGNLIILRGKNIYNLNGQQL